MARNPLEALVGTLAKVVHYSGANQAGTEYVAAPARDVTDDFLHKRIEEIKVYGPKEISFAVVQEKLESQGLLPNVIVVKAIVSPEGKTEILCSSPKQRKDAGLVPDAIIRFADEGIASSACSGERVALEALTAEKDRHTKQVDQFRIDGRLMAVELESTNRTASKAMAQSTIALLVDAVQQAVLDAEALLLGCSGAVGSSYAVSISREDRKLVVEFSGLAVVTDAVANALMETGLVDDVCVLGSTNKVAVHFVLSAARNRGRKRGREKDEDEREEEDDTREKKKGKSLFARILDAVMPGPSLT